jgi:hypothetical protein
MGLLALRAVWDSPDRPRLVAVPPDLKDALLADREALREVLSRAAAFRRQLAGRSIAPRADSARPSAEGYGVYLVRGG